MTTLESSINDFNNTMTAAHIAKNGKLTVSGALVIMAFSMLTEPSMFRNAGEDRALASSLSASKLNKSSFEHGDGSITKFRGWKSNASKYLQLLEVMGLITKTYNHIKLVRTAGFTINRVAMRAELNDTDVWNTVENCVIVKRDDTEAEVNSYAVAFATLVKDGSERVAASAAQDVKLESLLQGEDVDILDIFEDMDSVSGATEYQEWRGAASTTSATFARLIDIMENDTALTEGLIDGTFKMYKWIGVAGISKFVEMYDAAVAARDSEAVAA